MLEDYKDICEKFCEYLLKYDNMYYKINSNNDDDDELIYNFNDDIVFEEKTNVSILYEKFNDKKFHNYTMIEGYKVKDWLDIYNLFINVIGEDFINKLDYADLYKKDQKYDTGIIMLSVLTHHKLCDKLRNEYIRIIFNKYLDKSDFIFNSIKYNWNDALAYFISMNYEYTIESYEEAFKKNNFYAVKLLWQTNNTMLSSDKKIMNLACQYASLKIIDYLWCVDIYDYNKKYNISDMLDRHKHLYNKKNRCNHITIDSYLCAINRNDNLKIDVLTWLNNNTFFNNNDLVNLFKTQNINDYECCVQEWLKKYIL